MHPFIHKITNHSPNIYSVSTPCHAVPGVKPLPGLHLGIGTEPESPDSNSVPPPSSCVD